MGRLAPFIACLLGVVPASAGAIHDAAREGNVPELEAALAAGADINKANGIETPLFFAVSSGSLEAVKFLVEHGADVNAPGKLGPPLIAAASSCRVAMLKYLLAKGADAKAQVKTKTALHFAASNGNVDCIRLLIEAGADVNAQTGERETPLHFARRLTDPAAGDYIEQHGAVAPPKLSSVAAMLKSADAVRGKKSLRSLRLCGLPLCGTRQRYEKRT